MSSCVFYSPCLAPLCLSRGLPGLQSSGASIGLAHDSCFGSSNKGKERQWDSQVNKDSQSKELLGNPCLKAKATGFYLSLHCCGPDSRRELLAHSRLTGRLEGEEVEQKPLGLVRNFSAGG